jgi:hypothetical protein
MVKSYKVWLHVEVNNGPNADEEYEDAQWKAEGFADLIV